MRTIAAVFAFTALSAAPTLAFDGRFIRDACLSGIDTQVALCTGYTVGIAQTLRLADQWYVNSVMPDWCPPEDFDPKQAAAIVLTYMDENPGKESDDASVLMLASFAEAYPCE